METKVKLRTRKRMKLLTSIYQTLVLLATGLFLASIVGVIITSHDFILAHNNYVVGFLFTLLAISVIGCLSGVFAQAYVADLNSYKKQIKAYRARRHMIFIMKLLVDKKYGEAINHYNSMNSGDIKDFLHAFLLGALINSNDSKRAKRAKEDLEIVLERMKPDNVFN